MRTLCASTLIGEFFVIGFAGLVAMKDPDLVVATVWTVSGIAMALCVLFCGVITRPGGLQLGWALQVALIASAFLVVVARCGVPLTVKESRTDAFPPRVRVPSR